MPLRMKKAVLVCSNYIPHSLTPVVTSPCHTSSGIDLSHQRNYESHDEGRTLMLNNWTWTRGGATENRAFCSDTFLRWVKSCVSFFLLLLNFWLLLGWLYRGLSSVLWGEWGTIPRICPCSSVPLLFLFVFLMSSGNQVSICSWNVTDYKATPNELLVSHCMLWIRPCSGVITYYLIILCTFPIPGNKTGSEQKKTSYVQK